MMKPCAKNRKPIAWLVLGAFDDHEARCLREHIETCAGCRHYFEELTRLASKLDAAEIKPSPPGTEAFHQRVVARLRQAEQASPSTAPGWLRPPLPRWQVALPVAAAIAILAAVLFAALRPGTISPRLPRAAAPPAAEASLPPTAGNYQAIAARSPDEFEELLTQQARKRRPSAPVLRASDSARALGLD